MFGLIGDGNVFMADSYVKAGGRYVSVAHESAAVLAASGFARLAHRTAVATVTHGPALTNTFTALVESVRGRVPLVLLAGDTAVSRPDDLQNIDQSLVTVATGAGFVQLRGAEHVAEDVATAFRQAHVEQRPVILNMPIDLQWSSTDRFEPRVAATSTSRSAPDSRALDEALGIIASARRPLVLAGRGAMGTDARDAVLRLARRIGAPVATTLKARDLYLDETESIGVFGTLSDDTTIATILKSDCIVSFGASLTQWTTAHGDLVRHARTVQVDHEAAALGRHTNVDVAIHADVAAAAHAFAAALDEAEIDPTSFSDGVTRAVPTELGSGYDIASVLGRIDQRLDPDRSVVVDVGRFFHHAARMVRSRAGGAYVHAADFGSIGLSIGTALGMSAADPERTVLALVGDGGFMLGGITEFNTAVRHRMKIVVVVINDGSYGAEHIQFRRRDLDPAMSLFDWPDLANVATALGGAGFSVSGLDELDAALGALPGVAGPALIDVHLDPDNISSSRAH